MRMTKKDKTQNKSGKEKINAGVPGVSHVHDGE